MKVLKHTLYEHRVHILAALLLAMLFFALPASAAFSGSGAGTAGDPYQITTTSQWNEMNSYKSSSYKLMNDLDFSGVTVTGFDGWFTGGFDGNFKAVKNVVLPFVDDADYAAVGLFGRVDSGQPFKNLFVINATKTLSSNNAGSYLYAGIVFGVRQAQTAGDVRNIHVDSTSGITISGGSDNLFLGGIAGSDRGDDGKWVDCGSVATLSVASSGTNVVGGIVGKNGNHIDYTRCYYGGTLSTSAGTNSRGGIQGAGQWEGTRTDCYSDGTKNSYTTDGETQSGDVKTTSEMKASNTYSSWTFDSTHWKLSQNAGAYSGYPLWYAYADPVPAPVAGYTVNRTVMNKNSYAAFTDTSTNTPTSWAWDWDDGTANSTSKNANHQYTTAGYFHPVLTATNAGGSSSIQAQTMSIYDVPSGLSVTTPSNGAVVASGTTVTITGTKTGGTSFGDWIFYHGATHTHSATTTYNYQFNSAGVYDIRIGMLDAEGVEHISTAGAVYLTVTGAVTAAYTHSAEGDFPITITFTDSTSGSGTWASSVWNLGDGSSSSSRSPTHQYSSAGTFSASVIWTNTLGASGYYVHNIVITDPNSGINPPVAGFTANRTTILQGMAIAFTDDSTNSPTSWYWTFGNGAGAPADQTVENPVFVFNDYNIYDLTHTATNAVGTGSVTDMLAVWVYQPVTDVHLNTPATNQTISVGGTVTATGHYTGYAKSTTYSFNGVNWQASNAFTYSSSGIFPIAFRVEDAMGTNHASSGNIWVTVSGTVTPGFSMNASSGAIPKTIVFTDTSTGGTHASSLWNFGDGTTSTSQNPSHTYTVIGVYSPSLLWTNTAGASGYVSHNLSITQIAAPTASFNRTPVSGQAPVLVSMTDTSTGAPTSWYWTFGDGTSSTLQNPTHTYSTGGTYTITLVATNAGGSTSATGSVVFTSSGTPTVPGGYVPSNATINLTFWQHSPSVTIMLEPSVMETTEVPVEAWLGDMTNYLVNTTGITALNGYNVDGWKLVVFREKNDGTYDTSQTFIPPKDEETIFYTMIDTDEAVFSDTFGNRTHQVVLYAINNSYVASGGYPDYGQGLMLASDWYSQANDTVDLNVQYCPPHVDWYWASEPLTPVPNNDIGIIYYPNSLFGTDYQDYEFLSVETSANGGTTWTRYPGYSTLINTGVYGILKTAVVGWDVLTPTAPQMLRGRLIGAHSTGFDYSNLLYSNQPTVTIDAADTAPSFVWKNQGGTTITTAVDTQTIMFGLNTGTTSWQNLPPKASLTLTFQKWNPNTNLWDSLPAAASAYSESDVGAGSDLVDTDNSHTWGARSIAGFGSVIPNVDFSTTVPEGKYRAVMTGGGQQIGTAKEITVTTNMLNPVNVAEGAGGVMGFGSTGGVGTILIGLILTLGIGVLLFVFIRDARVFLVGSLIGAGISFALGLFPLWVMILAGIAGVAALLFASGILGGRGESGGGAAPDGGGV